MVPSVREPESRPLDPDASDEWEQSRELIDVNQPEDLIVPVEDVDFVTNSDGLLIGVRIRAANSQERPE